MSTFKCPVVKLGKIGKHPNADSLSIWNGPQGPLCFRTEDFKEGDLATFIPADSIVPLFNPVFSFLSPRNATEPDATFRVRGVRLRGIPSVGLLVRAPPGASDGDDGAEFYGVKKYEPAQTHSFFTNSNQVNAPDGIPDPTYDVENTWIFGKGVVEGTSTQALDFEGCYHISEKIHGCNFRCYMDPSGKVYVGSRSRWVSEGNVWHDAYKMYQGILDQLMKSNPGHIFFGEVYGKVQDLHYGRIGVDLVLFDMFDAVSGRYVPISRLGTELAKIEDGLKLMVPYAGQFVGKFGDAIEYAKTLATGMSRLDDKTIKEGVVIRPVGEERLVFGKGINRLMTKVISPEYLSRKNGTENQ